MRQRLNHNTNAILVNVKNHLKIVDNSLVYATDMEDMYNWTVNIIKLCGKKGMILNPKKFEFGVKETDFAGFRVGGGKVRRPMKSHVKAIQNFPEPKNITEMRSFMAMCEQVSYAAKI